MTTVESQGTYKVSVPGHYKMNKKASPDELMILDLLMMTSPDWPGMPCLMSSDVDLIVELVDAPLVVKPEVVS